MPTICGLQCRAGGHIRMPLASPRRRLQRFAMRRRSIAAEWALLSLLFGCDAQSVCDEAVDKLEECDIPGQIAKQGYSRLPLAISRDDCSGTNECCAKCVAPATCAELKNTFITGGTDPNS